MACIFVPKLRKENSRLWGEEKEADAVWGVFLKKVRYQRPSSIVQIIQAGGNHGNNGRGGSGGSQSSSSGTDETDHQAEIAHLMWETVRVRVLRAGSLRRIVEAIQNDDTDVQVSSLPLALVYKLLGQPALVPLLGILTKRISRTNRNWAPLSYAIYDLQYFYPNLP